MIKWWNPYRRKCREESARLQTKYLPDTEACVDAEILKEKFRSNQKIKWE